MGAGEDSVRGDKGKTKGRRTEHIRKREIGRRAMREWQRAEMRRVTRGTKGKKESRYLGKRWAKKK